MAPEQFRYDEKLTGATDIYALGLVAYTLLVGKPYWINESKNAGDVIAFALVAARGTQESAVQRAAEWGIDLPASFDAWFARVTALKPSERFRTATEAVERLQEVFDEPEVLVHLPSPTVEGQCQASLTLPAGPLILQNPPDAPSPTMETTITVTARPVLPSSTTRIRKWDIVVIMALVLGGLGTGGWLAWGRNDWSATESDEPVETSNSAATSATGAVTSSAPVGSAEPIPSATSLPSPIDSTTTRSKPDTKNAHVKPDLKRTSSSSAAKQARAPSPKLPVIPPRLYGQK